MFSPLPPGSHSESEPEIHEQHWFWIGLNRRDPAGDRSWRWSDGLGVSRHRAPHARVLSTQHPPTAKLNLSSSTAGSNYCCHGGDFGNVLPKIPPWLAVGVQGTNPALVETQPGSPNPACLSRPPSSSTTTLTAATTTTTTSGTARCWTWRPCSGCRCSAKPSWTGSANCPKVAPGRVGDCRYLGAREQGLRRSSFLEQDTVQEEGRGGLVEPVRVHLFCKLCFCGRMSLNLVVGGVKGAAARPGGVQGISAPCRWCQCGASQPHILLTASPFLPQVLM